MSMTNSVTIIGNLTRDPELTYTSGGYARCSFSVAVNKKMGEREETSYIDCTLWREAAENFAESLGKGARVIVVGEMRQHSWKTDDGQNRSRIELAVDAVGPDLRWATAAVTKVANNGSANGGGNGGRRNAPSQPAAQPVGVGGGDGGYDPFNDESPF